MWTVVQATAVLHCALCTGYSRTMMCTVVRATALQEWATVVP